VPWDERRAAAHSVPAAVPYWPNQSTGPSQGRIRSEAQSTDHRGHGGPSIDSLVTSPSDDSLLFPWVQFNLFPIPDSLCGLLWRSPTDCSWHKLSTRARYAAYHYSLIRNLLQRGESAHVFTAAAWGTLVDDRALREHCSKRAQQILRSSACPLVVCGNVYTSVIIPSLVPCSGFCSAFYFILFF